MRERDGRTDRDADQGRDADSAHAHNQRQPDDRKQSGVAGQQELKRRDGWFHAAYLAPTLRKWSISEDNRQLADGFMTSGYPPSAIIPYLTEVEVGYYIGCDRAARYVFRGWVSTGLEHSLSVPLCFLLLGYVKGTRGCPLAS
jgi:hypothetical protein